MGSSDGNVYRGRLRWGRGQWFMGSAFPYILASGLFRAKEKPYLVGGALIVLGYLLAGIKGDPRYDDPVFRKGLRKWQYDRLLGLMRGRGVR
jgi:biofilm PGA synthesis N-glycosyltransferase PgaC